MSFSELLSSRMASLGISQADLARVLADRTGVPIVRQRINNWCRGLAVPDASLLADLARALELDVLGARDLYVACGVNVSPVLGDPDPEAAAS